ncbi:DNA-binding protein [Pseudomonas sp. FSL R10-2964]|uniref:DNA-binding protein n=1 Tax=Pseudomonas sp. FSL R10-2964 TaxID=2662202 RepID=UPI001295F0BB|nr:DNA-binding protein [Pseudomonas sp. FSL R10-2964]MQT83633.1 DNA-binding protein [Pseudomonas sp. FSL R10-2964]
MSIDDEILIHLQRLNVVPLLGGLVPENATAEMLGYAPSYFRRLAAAGNPPLPYVRRGNRRFYKIVDISRFATETVQ